MTIRFVHRRLLSLLVAALCATSCLPPKCVDRVFGPPGESRRGEHLATLALYAEPVEGAVATTGPAGTDPGDLYRRVTRITTDVEGDMAVSPRDPWPRSCPRIPAAALADVSRAWQPLLDEAPAPRTALQLMANAADGGDRRPDGPLLSLTVGPTTGKRVDILWDGRSRLPDALDAAILVTLDTFCSHSRAAKRSLLRDLPRQVAERLECRRR